MPQGEANGPQPERGVRLLLNLQLGKALLASDIDRPDVDGRGVGRLGDSRIGGQVVLFFGQAGALEIDEFRTEEPDPLRPEREGHFDFIRKLDVGQGKELHIIQSDRFELGRLLEFPEIMIVPFLLAQEFFSDSQRRVDNNFAVRSVDDDEVAVLDLLGDIVEADHRRYAQRARQDGGMRCRPSHICGHGQDVPPAEPDGRLRRQHFMGDQDLLLLPVLFRPALHLGL